ncbi:MAG: DUF1566 domain-containing protein [Candidatus Brennerbacteria bacterium]|nr:DUF1566 domain-containing protein [Candidatus Brennerbacteria bacterium]
MLKRKKQWQINDIYSGRHRTFNIRTRRSFWQKHFYPVVNAKRSTTWARFFGGVLKGGLTVMISVLMIYGIVQAGSLTPSASPAATMRSLQELWDKIAGTTDNTSTTADMSGNVTQMVKYIAQHMPGGFTYGSSDAAKVLTTAGGTYNATLLTVANVRSGVAFGVSSTGTYGGTGWTYGSDDITKVLTTADAAGTYNASNLSVGVVKSGTTFGVSLTGAYPSATSTLPNATTTTDLAASGNNISSSNGAVEWWQSDGTRQTATLDFPTLSNLCNNDTSNNSSGTLSVTAAYLGVGNTWCGTAGTLLASLFNGTNTDSTFPGGSQANGGVDDYNNNGTRPSDTYSKGWTACAAGNSYCGTGLASADARDDSTGLIWSMPCNGSGCASFSDATPLTYSWDNSAANNASSTASQLCSAGAHGQTGWSLPHQKQLMQAYIDGSWGNLEGVNRNYWSATTRSDNTTNAWYVWLSSGFTNFSAKTISNPVRCVR